MTALLAELEARLRAAEAERDALLARLGEADERLTRERAHIADLERKIKHVKERARQAAKRKAVDVERLNVALVDALESGQRVHALPERAQKIAKRLGVELGYLHGGLSVNGHHGTASLGGGSKGGCGTYDLVLNVAEERVDCAHCGAVDLVKVTT